MKKTISETGVEHYSHIYRGVECRFYLNDKGLINGLSIFSKGVVNVVTADIHDDKHPDGMPDTPYWRKKLAAEIEMMIDNNAQTFNANEDK